jgi:hypothetical protein
MSTMCTSTRLSMAWFVAYRIGLIQAFTAMCVPGCIRPIGQGMLRCQYRAIDSPVFEVGSGRLILN